MSTSLEHGQIKVSSKLGPATKSIIVLGVAMCLGVSLIAVNRLSDSHLTTCGKSPPLAMATAIESAVNNFYTEYDRLPATSKRIETDSADGVNFLNVLLGTKPAYANPLNQRGVRFVAIKEAKNGRGGIVYSKSRQVEGLYDQWGSPYIVEIDTDQDEFLEFKLGSRTVMLKGRHVAVHSPGPDRKSGTSDDVRTW